MAAEPGVSCIIIKGIPSTVTPVLIPTPDWANAGLTHESDGWYARFCTPRSSTTYVVSAFGYTSQNVTISGDTVTTITMVQNSSGYLFNKSGKVYMINGKAIFINGSSS